MNIIRRYIALIEGLTDRPPAPGDNSHEARMTRAREMGFDPDDPHYFGTPNGDFDEVDLDRTPDENLAYGRGAYATRDTDAASGYSKPGTSWGNDTDDEPAPTVYKVFLKVKNPLDLDKVYPFAEIKRIFDHCFPDGAEHIEFWHDLQKEAYNWSDEADVEDEHRERTETEELEDQLYTLEGADSHADIDPDDYDDGENDEEYITDVEKAVEYDLKEIKQRLDRIEQREAEEAERHATMLASGRIASAYGREIYKTLWQNTDGYHDWQSESQLFGGETDTIEFKTEANRWLEELGYDGLRHIDRYNPGNRGKSHAVTIAFQANQVRSAHANFDPDKAGSAKLSEDE